ncbi:TPA: hypothetical protein U5E00_003856 [Yersinia enterocolitica]|uniref:hypothetical protein n=1 Tax=Yersinia enterocolitica TaxID=630 RepID=UPI0005DAEBE2|nr:hypothetical protein [Yersinia enterocolitica]EKN6008006.1 hypothetical protein [Yersinia enterocolitica]EMA9489955.1 hypothetical protein [Yersinia enterocolitica]CQJ56201.1 Uncharacterised protein [Yersinia enterocolitica]HDL6702863.1 hypothetical protein [Yersinia enterocolitica]HEN3584775.1 hypothetical protein [Yersinia enterocolitica]
MIIKYLKLFVIALIKTHENFVERAINYGGMLLTLALIIFNKDINLLDTPYLKYIRFLMPILVVSLLFYAGYRVWRDEYNKHINDTNELYKCKINHSEITVSSSSKCLANTFSHNMPIELINNSEHDITVRDIDLSEIKNTEGLVLTELKFVYNGTSPNSSNGIGQSVYFPLIIPTKTTIHIVAHSSIKCSHKSFFEQLNFISSIAKNKFQVNVVLGLFDGDKTLRYKISTDTTRYFKYFITETKILSPTEHHLLEEKIKELGIKI